jgi:hypothetical protein
LSVRRMTVGTRRRRSWTTRWPPCRQSKRCAKRAGFRTGRNASGKCGPCNHVQPPQPEPPVLDGQRVPGFVSSFNRLGLDRIRPDTANRVQSRRPDQSTSACRIFWSRGRCRPARRCVVES